MLLQIGNTERKKEKNLNINDKLNDLVYQHHYCNHSDIKYTFSYK